MAIIGGSGQAADEPAGTTIIAHGTRLVGDLAVTGKLHIDGEFSGEITTVGEVTIGERGVVAGTIRAHRLLVAGRLRGTAICQGLEIVSSGRVQGSVEADQLIVERGAQLEGNSQMGMVPKAAWDPLVVPPSSRDRQLDGTY